MIGEERYHLKHHRFAVQLHISGARPRGKRRSPIAADQGLTLTSTIKHLTRKNPCVWNLPPSRSPAAWFLFLTKILGVPIAVLLYFMNTPCVILSSITTMLVMSQCSLRYQFRSKFSSCNRDQMSSSMLALTVPRFQSCRPV